MKTAKSEPVAPRFAEEIAADVDRGLIVVAKIEKLQNELKEIEARLIADTLARPDEHEALEDKDREGKQFFAKGSALRLPIVLTADSLVKSFAPDSDVHLRIFSASDGSLPKFFKPVTKYETQFEDGKLFRAAAKEILGDKAPAFIAACLQLNKFKLPKSTIQIQWQRAAAHQAIEEAAEEGQE